MRLICYKSGMKTWMYVISFCFGLEKWVNTLPKNTRPSSIAANGGILV